MKINLEFNDRTSLLISEVIRNAEHLHGENVKVRVSPDSSAPIDIIYFGIQQMITSEQLSLLYDSDNYNKDISVLRATTLSKLGSILDQVIIDNETRVT